MAGGWGCPHEVNDTCAKLDNRPCDPGMKGCVLAGRFLFADADKNRRLREKQARSTDQSAEETSRSGAPQKNPLDDLFP